MKLRPLLFLGTALALSLNAHADWGRRHTESFSKGGDFSATGSVSIENVNGKITVETWDRDAYAIEGEKKSKSAEDLALIDLQWELSSDRIELKVRLPKKKGWFKLGNVDGQVDVVVKIPATARLDEITTVNGAVTITGVLGDVKASTVNGGIAASNLGGSARLRTVNGGVTADFDTLPPTARLKLETVNGGIKLRLPADAGASLRASVVNGHIDAEIPITMQGKIGRKSLNGTIGDGAAVIEMNTVNGGITIQPR